MSELERLIQALRWVMETGAMAIVLDEKRVMWMVNGCGCCAHEGTPPDSVRDLLNVFAREAEAKGER